MRKMKKKLRLGRTRRRSFPRKLQSRRLGGAMSLKEKPSQPPRPTLAPLCLSSPRRSVGWRVTRRRPSGAPSTLEVFLRYLRADRPPRTGTRRTVGRTSRRIRRRRKTIGTRQRSAPSPALPPLRARAPRGWPARAESTSLIRRASRACVGRGCTSGAELRHVLVQAGIQTIDRTCVL